MIRIISGHFRKSCDGKGLTLAWSLATGMPVSVTQLLQTWARMPEGMGDVIGFIL